MEIQGAEVTGRLAVGMPSLWGVSFWGDFGGVRGVGEGGGEGGGVMRGDELL